MLFSQRHRGWLYAQAWKCKRWLRFVFFSYCFFFICTVTTHCFRASDSLLNLCCVIVPVFFSLSLFFILNHSFLLRCQPGVGAAALLVTTTIVWLCLLIFNIETIKPLAPQLDFFFSSIHVLSLGLEKLRSGSQNSYPLNCSTFCHIVTTNICSIAILFEWQKTKREE